MFKRRNDNVIPNTGHINVNDDSVMYLNITHNYVSVLIWIVNKELYTAWEI